MNTSAPQRKSEVLDEIAALEYQSARQACLDAREHLPTLGQTRRGARKFAAGLLPPAPRTRRDHRDPSPELVRFTRHPRAVFVRLAQTTWNDDVPTPDVPTLEFVCAVATRGELIGARHTTSSTTRIADAVYAGMAEDATNPALRERIRDRWRTQVRTRCLNVIADGRGPLPRLKRLADELLSMPDSDWVAAVREALSAPEVVVDPEDPRQRELLTLAAKTLGSIRIRYGEISHDDWQDARQDVLARLATTPLEEKHCKPAYLSSCLRHSMSRLLGEQARSGVVAPLASWDRDHDAPGQGMVQPEPFVSEPALDDLGMLMELLSTMEAPPGTDHPDLFARASLAAAEKVAGSLRANPTIEAGPWVTDALVRHCNDFYLAQGFTQGEARRLSRGHSRALLLALDPSATDRSA
ncbi:MAG: hypothetical protein ACK5MT_17360 [Actinomycetales bacterium]